MTNREPREIVKRRKRFPTVYSGPLVRMRRCMQKKTYFSALTTGLFLFSIAILRFPATRAEEANSTPSAPPTQQGDASLQSLAPPDSQQPPEQTGPKATEGNSPPVSGNSPPPLNSAPPLSRVREIEAKTYPVEILKRSSSQRIYVFSDPSKRGPQVGRIFLLKKDTTSVMAFRILKVYGEKSEFAARRVRWYDSFRLLDPGSAYVAVEKVQDLRAPILSAQDQKDLKELEGGAAGEGNPSQGAAGTPEPRRSDLPLLDDLPSVQQGRFKNRTPEIPPDPVRGVEVKPFDSDLDSPSTAAPKGAIDSQNELDSPKDFLDPEDEDSEIELVAKGIEDVTPLDGSRQWFTVGVSYLRNNTTNGGSGYFVGAGGRYGITLIERFLIRAPRIQDALAIEIGAYSYRISNFVTAGDAYTIASVLPTGRYTLALGQDLGIFFYGGVMRNFLLPNSVGSDEFKTAIDSLLPAAGAGVLIRLGPGWDLRFDAGYDVVGAGLVLKL
jgi:hypothetical protein